MRRVAIAVLLLGLACSREEPSAYTGWDPASLRLEKPAADAVLTPGATVELGAAGLIGDRTRILVRMGKQYVNPDRVVSGGLAVTVPQELSSMRGQWVPVQVLISRHRSSVVMMRVAAEEEVP